MTSRKNNFNKEGAKKILTADQLVAWALDTLASGRDNRFDRFRFLLASGANPDWVLNDEGKTFAMQLATYADLKAFKILCEYHPDLTAKDIYGQTVMTHAVATEDFKFEEAPKHLPHEAMTCHLLDLGLPFSPGDFIMASRSGQAEPVRRMLASGKVSVDAQDEYGQTAVMLAAWNGHTDTVKDLLAAGASVLIKNRKGKTVLDLLNSRPKEERNNKVLALIQEEVMPQWLLERRKNNPGSGLFKPKK